MSVAITRQKPKMNLVLCCVAAFVITGLLAWRFSGNAYQTGGVNSRPWVLFTSGRPEGPLGTSAEGVSYPSSDGGVSEVCLADGASKLTFRFSDPHPPAIVYFGLDQYSPENTTVKKVSVNGSEVVTEKLGHFPEFETATWDITSRVHPGDNEIQVSLSPSTQGPLWIRGAYVAPDNLLTKTSSRLPDLAARYLPVLALICFMFFAVAGTYLALARTVWKHVDLPVADSIVHSVTCMVLACCLAVLLVPQYIWFSLVVLAVVAVTGLAAFILARNLHSGVRKKL